MQTKAAVDRSGRPVPWYTYPAIEYLQQFDFSQSRVFEYGSGNSTLFWTERAAQVVSVEDDERWYANIRPRLGANCTLVLEPDLDRFVDVITRFPERFDIIVVDGPARGQTRLKCAARALECLRPGGLIILDNSDWLPRSARLLRGTGLLQVDMSGFIPLGGHTQTTSFFFDRTCELRPRDGRQPHP
ncbi:MAG: class I SAM-dependent methyltransferase, partial [Vicinamibacterales bacterium]